jgi:pyruvate dehydrogenase E1 component
MWAMADQLANGFLLGATAGRTTLNGEGLQHEDGHSLLLAATNPACVAYDPAFAYELAIIVHDALRRMYGDAKPGEDTNVFYYLTLYNEPKPQPAAPELPDLADQVLRGMYRFAPAPDIASQNGGPPRAQLLASGTAIHWALDAQRLLAADWGVAADVWSVTSWTELRREGLACDKANRLAAASDGDTPQQLPWVTQQLEAAPGPVIAVSDWMRAVPDQIEKWVPGDWSSLGTDGFGRSDTREALRRYFSVDAQSIVLAALTELARLGEVKPDTPAEAISRYSLG